MSNGLRGRRQVLRDRRLGALIVFEKHANDAAVRNLALAGLGVLAISAGSVPPGVIQSSEDRILHDVLSVVQHNP